VKKIFVWKSNRVYLCLDKHFLQTKVATMKVYNWEDFTDEDLKDEINLAHQVIKEVKKDPDLSEFQKQIIIDDCLDNLNALYNEQRKRSSFKRNFGTT
jgi:hypothetical protein